MKSQNQAGSSKKSPSQQGATSEAKAEKQQQQQSGKSKQPGEKASVDNQHQSGAVGRKSQKQQS